MKRNTWSKIHCNGDPFIAITDVLIILGVVAYIINMKYMSKTIEAVLWLVIGLCDMAMICTVLAGERAKFKRRNVFKRARMIYSIIQFLETAASITLIACLFCRIYIGGSLLSVNEEPVFAYGEQYTIAANINTVLLLQKEEWEKLNFNERMAVLQCICDIEGNYLGLNRRIHINASKLDENVNGYYDDSTSSIQISIDLVEAGDPYETLKTVCHEMYHAGQARYVEIFEGLDDDAKRLHFLYDASVYAQEFRDYKSARMTDDVSDYLEYYGQRCERDAREYAYKSVVDYYRRINKYLDQNSDSSDE